MTKIRVGILFGGRSGEHEVSLLSAASVLEAIDKERYEVVPIGITKEGRWVTAGRAEQLLRSNNVGKADHEPRHLRAGDPDITPGAAVLAKGESVVVPPVPVHSSTGAITSFAPEGDATMARRWTDNVIKVDVVFPVLHGTFG